MKYALVKEVPSKYDCMFGHKDLDLNEITYVSEVLRKLNSPIVYSLSPGKTVTPAVAKDASGLVNRRCL